LPFGYLQGGVLPTSLSEIADETRRSFFFFTLVTGPRRSLFLKLGDTRVYEPQIRARLGTTAHFCGVVVLKLRAVAGGGGAARWLATQRQPRGKSMVPLVNSHTNATRIGWHLWEIDLRFAPGLPPGCWRGRSGEMAGDADAAVSKP